MQLTIFADNSDYCTFPGVTPLLLCWKPLCVSFSSSMRAEGMIVCSPLSGYNCIQCYCQNNVSNDQLHGTIISAFVLLTFLTLDSLSLLSSVTVLFVVTLLTTMLKANIWYLLCLKLITLLTTEFPSFYSIYLDTHVLIWCTTILFLVPILPQKQSVVEKCNYIDWYNKIRWDKQNRVTLHKTIY